MHLLDKWLKSHGDTNRRVADCRWSPRKLMEIVSRTDGTVRSLERSTLNVSVFGMVKLSAKVTAISEEINCGWRWL